MPLFEDLTLLNWAMLVLIVLFAGMVHGTLGIGFPLVATPLIATLTDVRSAMIMLLLPTLCINVANIVRGGNWGQSIGRFWPLALWGAVGSIAGTRLVVATDPSPYRLLLAGAILLYLNVDRFGMRMNWIRRRPRLSLAVFGLTGGLLAGTVNVMLPALVIFALEMGLSPTAMVQTFNFCFLFGKISQGSVFAVSGLLSPHTLLATTPLAAAALAALAVGMTLRDRLDAETYRGWLRKILFLLSLLLVGQFLAAD
jgi:uncharacterized membrane protein YfcA